MRVFVFSLFLMAIFATCFLFQEARGASMSPSSPSPSSFSFMHNMLDMVASNILSYIDQGIGRQARSSFGEIFGISNDDAMKSLFVKILEWLVGLIAELIFNTRALN
ncbi:hypothetical protein TCAL_09391 [Tigriopus californicus]|uniref:Uncharacterized protein n=1 Tax=Tigriopus californicus TaxID=6832 RepID=A0A553NSV8_TIGCA|nr:hypothetical protein TCAL_09391 [Tigriopus californicus]|eukprot:TCALIF_09391-PA protein Name:"Protein of unknown function" AED:0.00 eAED:0.00 QI:326/1/1/1/0/0/2/125/106